MQCPKCAAQAKCSDSRPDKLDRRVRRYRCTVCKTRFASLEEITHIIGSDEEHIQPPRYAALQATTLELVRKAVKKAFDDHA